MAHHSRHRGVPSRITRLFPVLLLLFSFLFFPAQARAQCIDGFDIVEVDSIANASGYIATSGNYAYVLVNGDFTVIDITDPGNMTTMGTLSGVPGAITKSYASGNYVYVYYSGDLSLRVIDVSDPNNPVLRDQITTNEQIGEFTVSGNYLYIPGVTNDYLAVYDISDPDNIFQTDVTADTITFSSASAVAISGNYAFVTKSGMTGDPNGITAVDISDPYNISVVASISGTAFTDASSIKIQNDVAYVAGDSGDLVTAVDVSDPNNMAILDSITDATLDRANIIEVSGNYAFVTNVGLSFRILDITDPANLAHVGGLRLSLSLPRSVKFANGHVFLTVNGNLVAYELQAFGGAGGSLGVCSSAGTWHWDATNSTMAYCNGSDWISIAGGSSIGSCSTAGQLYYDNGASNYVFCDGSDLIPVANNGVSGSCANNGEVDYNTTSNTLTWCNGAAWVDMSGGSSGPELHKCVFVTSTTYKGSLGGVAAADAACNTLAAQAGMPGTFKAWLASSAGDDPESTFTRASIPYKDPTQRLLANDWNDLVDGTLAGAIYYTEGGKAPPATQVWTGVSSAGTFTDDTCSSWGSGGGGSGASTEGSGADAGSATATDGTWSDIPANNYKCGSSLPLYCFQQ